MSNKTVFACFITWVWISTESRKILKCISWLLFNTDPRILQCVWSYDANQFCLVESPIYAYKISLKPFKTKLKVLYNGYKSTILLILIANLSFNRKLFLNYLLKKIWFCCGSPLQEFILGTIETRKPHDMATRNVFYSSTVYSNRFYA